MSNDFYNHNDGVPATLTRGASTTIRSEFDLVQAGFDKLPSLQQAFGGTENYAVAAGSPDAWTVSVAPTVLTSYTDGMQVRVKFPAANATTTPTMNVNALGAKSIVAEDGTAIAAGNIALNMIATLTYNASSGKLHMTDTAIASATAAAASASAANASAGAAAASASGSASSAAAALLSRDQTASAAALSGIAKFYDTYALALADVATPALNSLVEVFQDENYGKRRTLYVKTGSSTLTWKAFADGPQTSSGYSRPKGIFVHNGDSNTNGRPGWRTAYEAEWFGSGGVFEGWTSYNIGHNGSVLDYWANTLITDADNPASAGFQPLDYNLTDPDHEVIRTINANPDWIRIRLGTNDLNSPSNRITIGVETTLRTNLAKLVNYYLAKTKAKILLVCPQPFAYAPSTTLATTTQWVNAAEAAEASRRLRQVYSEWVGVSDRVIVHNTHEDLFGSSCDNDTVNGQDPFGQGALIGDELHCTNLGYRREAQREARMFDPSYPYNPIFTIEPVTIPENAMWTGTLRAKATMGAVTSGTLDFDLSPASVLQNTTGNVATVGTESLAVPLRSKRIVEAAAKTANLAVFRQLLGIPRPSKIIAYNWANGQTYNLTGLSLSQIVTATPPDYATLNIASGSSLSGLGGGPVTFYVTDETAVPFARPRSATTAMTTTDKTFGAPYNGFTFSGGVAFRKPASGTPVISVYQQNQGDQRQIDGTGTFAAPGKLVGTFTFASFNGRATFVFDPTNFPAGSLTMTVDWLMARVTTGTIATDFSGNADIVLTSA